MATAATATTKASKAAPLTQLLGIARTWADASGVMTEAEYRQRMARMFGGRTSATQLTRAEQYHLLTTLFERELGWKRTGKGGTPAPGSGRRKLERSPASTKIRALWLFLYVLGEVRDSSERALAHYIKRQVGVEDLHWLTSQQKSDVIEALKFWAVRPMSADVAKMRAALENPTMRQDPPAYRDALVFAERAANSASWAPWWRAWQSASAALGRKVDEAIAKPLATPIRKAKPIEVAA
ncbi:regulatory protein GemA [Vitreoscilla filiformis]|nr:regulatory protein GemA [Vitreoscilla filiformis]